MSPNKRDVEQVKDEGTRTQVILAGSLSGLISRFVIAPLDVVKIRLQLQPHSLSDPLSCDGIKGPTYKGVFPTLRAIAKQEGIRALWKGNIPAELLYLCYGGVQFVTYRGLGGLQARMFKGTGVPDGAMQFVSGAGAGAMATGATYPLDLLRTRFAAQGTQKVYEGLIKAVKNIRKDEGAKGYFRGLTAALGSIVPYMGLFFMSYEFFHQELGGKQLPLATGDAVAGVAASVVAKTATFPLDLVRKRLQIQGPTRMKYVHTNVPVYQGVFRALYAIWKKEGYRGWYRGLTVSLVKAAPASAVTMYVYERTLHAMMHTGHEEELWELYSGYGDGYDD